VLSQSGLRARRSRLAKRNSVGGSVLNNLRGVALEVTANCNLRCSYCYEWPRPEPSDTAIAMEPDVALAAVSWLADNVAPGVDRPTVSFWGGEPLLNLGLIKHVTGSGPSLSPSRFFFSIVTNGTLLTDPVLDYFRSEDFHIVLSVDGPPAVQDRHRLLPDGSGSFAHIEPSIDRLTSEFPDTIALMTVTPETVPSMARSCEYLVNRGFKRLSFSYAFTETWTAESEQEYLDQLERIVDLWATRLAEDRRVAILPVELALRHLLTGQTVPCAAANRMVAVGIDGTLYPCHRFCGFYDLRSAYAMGDVRVGIQTPPPFLTQRRAEASRSQDRKTADNRLPTFSCPAGEAWEKRRPIHVSDGFSRRAAEVLSMACRRAHHDLYGRKSLAYLELYLALMRETGSAEPV
jgi:uncharacterized protein